MEAVIDRMIDCYYISLQSMRKKQGSQKISKVIRSAKPYMFITKVNRIQVIKEHSCLILEYVHIIHSAAGLFGAPTSSLNSIALLSGTVPVDFIDTQLLYTIFSFTPCITTQQPTQDHC